MRERFTDTGKRRTAKQYLHDKALESIRLLGTPGLMAISKENLMVEIMVIYDMAVDLEWRATVIAIDRYLDEKRNRVNPGINNGGISNVAEKR
jgi:hypothetical protein